MSKALVSSLLMQGEGESIMHSLIELWESVRDFIATGGDVLYIVALVLFMMWVLIIERFWFIARQYPVMRDRNHL